MTVLLTGGTGLTGAALLPRLAARDEVVALHRPETDPPVLDGVTWVAQDLAAPLDESRLPGQVDAVIHLAQSPRYREFPEGAAHVFDVNAGATVRLLDYGRRRAARSFVYASSGSVYRLGPQPITEDDEAAPSNFYAVSKLAAERAAEQFRGELSVALLRFFFIYGPGQANMFIPGIIGRLAGGAEISLAGEDGIRVNPVYVDDAAAAVLAAAERGASRALNVAGPDIVSLREIADVVGRELGVEPRFTSGPPQPDLVASIERMREHLGAPMIGVVEGLRRTVAAQRA